MRSLAEELSGRYRMDPHEEGGSFVDLKAERVAGVRDASGAIYYHLPPGQAADFHAIDCDEYWAFVAGDTLELWVVSPDGELAVELLGVEAPADPLVFVPTGSVFAARAAGAKAQREGTFLSCITVPRFEYDGWRLVERDALEALCPAALAFYEPAPRRGAVIDRDAGAVMTFGDLIAFNPSREKTVVCFGDSNTYGFIPGGRGRYPRDVRWPGVLQKLLGPGYHVVEEGLSGRTTAFDWPDCPWKNGLRNVRPCFASHTPVDAAVIMLGSNDCNKYLGISPGQTTEALRLIVAAVRDVCAAAQDYPPEILIVGPAPIGEGYRGSMFAADLDDEAIAKSQALAGMQRQLAADLDCRFLDAGDFASASDEDSEHFSPEAHAALAEHVAEVIRQMFEQPDMGQRTQGR